jgi:hypothetical protein
VGTALSILLGFVLLLLLAGTVLRVRKLRRDKRMRESIGVDPRPRAVPMAAPERSKSFRFLQENEDPSEAVIEKPRIDSARKRIFDDGEEASYDQYHQPETRGRHDNDWLLDRSRHRRDPMRPVKLLLLAVVVIAAGSGIVYYLLHKQSVHH